MLPNIYNFQDRTDMTVGGGGWVLGWRQGEACLGQQECPAFWWWSCHGMCMPCLVLGWWVADVHCLTACTALCLLSNMLLHTFSIHSYPRLPLPGEEGGKSMLHATYLPVPHYLCVSTFTHTLPPFPLLPLPLEWSVRCLQRQVTIHCTPAAVCGETTVGETHLLPACLPTCLYQCIHL